MEDRLHDTIIWAAVALWFAQGWYFNIKMEAVHRKLDRIIEDLNPPPESIFDRLE